MRIPLKDTFLRAPITKRLWLGAGAVAVFIGTLLVVQSFIPGDPNDEVMPGLHLKCDFIAFYTGGRLVRDGRSADLFSIPKVHASETQTFRDNRVSVGSAVGPWWNPPFYAWVFVPLARFSYPHALEIWVALNLLCAAIAAFLLSRIIAQAGPCEPAPSLTNVPAPSSLSTQHSALSTYSLVPVLMLLSTPFIHALSHGQNTCTSLLLVTIAVFFWRQKRAVASGLVTGLMFYKPQLGAVLSTVLVLSLGWRALIGLGISGTFLFLATLTLPGSLHDFLFQMPRNLHYVQCDVVYMWDRHVTYKAFWRLLLQGTAAGEPKAMVTLLSTTCSAVIGAALLRAAIRGRTAWRRGAANSMVSPSVRRDRLIAAAIAATPLLMPFYFDYDQLLLMIPAVLMSADMMRRDPSLPMPRTDLWLMRLWPAYYAWLMFNPDVAALTHVNFGVVLLSGVAGLLIARAARDRDAVSEEMRPEISRSRYEVRLAAA